jgi:UDP-N-acetyl-D-mannosaminuronic acid dehydrogenase
MNSKNLEVWGYDINPNTVADLSRTESFRVTDSFEEIPKAEIYIVCVSTRLVNDRPDMSAVLDVCESISKISNRSTLVSIESTILPSTSRKIFNEIFGRQISLVHVPHRYWADEPEKHGVNQVRVIGALNTESLERGLEFYEKVLGIQLHTCASIEIAEMSKIIENSHRYLQIAFAEELKLMCEKLNLDFDELQAACNTKWNVDMPQARDGIGRHCLPKDIRYVTFMSPSELLKTAIDVDTNYRQWLKKHNKLTNTDFSRPEVLNPLITQL